MNGLALEFLHEYLAHKNAQIQKVDFNYKLSSHPDFPSLLSLSETLDEFRIKNHALKVSLKDLEFAPKTFLGAVISNNSEIQYKLFKKIDEDTFEIKDDKESWYLSKNQLEGIWGGALLIIESNRTPDRYNLKLSFFTKVLLTCLICLLPVLITYSNNLIVWILSLLNTTGLVLSFYTWKDLINFGDNLILDKVCGESPERNCSKIFTSQKWKIFQLFPLSEISIVFFSAQLFGLIIFTLNNNLEAFLEVNRILALLSVPVVLVSITYQVFIEKYICRICLGISLVLISEVILLWDNSAFITSPASNSILQSVLIIIIISIAIFRIKSLLLSKNELDVEYIKANRIARNYQVFKQTLIHTATHVVSDEVESLSIFKSKESKPLNITLVINPHCEECMVFFKECLELIPGKYQDSINLKIIMKALVDKTNPTEINFYKKLISLYLLYDVKDFLNGLKIWETGIKYDQWLQEFKDYKVDENSLHILEKQYDWCLRNDLRKTPSLLIEGFKMPQPYTHKDLLWFFKDLIEDRGNLKKKSKPF